MKTKIFCYGTLQEPNVQMELIGRIVLGELVSIEGYVILRDYVDPQDGIAYPRIVPMQCGCVYGRILEFTDDEIKILNDYETDMYILKRITINGDDVSIYVQNPNYQS